MTARVVRVLPDVPAIDKEFDYLVPDGVEVELGDVVRVDLHGRRVGGWVVALDVEPEAGVTLRPLRKVSGRGPGADLLELSTWAAWRWAGRRASFLRTAAPPGVVRSVPLAPSSRTPTGVEPAAPLDRALALDRAVLRWPPAADRYALVRVAVEATPAEAGTVLVLCPAVAEARTLGRRLKADGFTVAVLAADGPGAAAAGEWAAAAGRADVVVGARAAAWAPVHRERGLGRVVLLDEHDEAYQGEQSPTWHARDVVAERARRAGAPCLLVSPCPTLEALDWGDLVVPVRPVERAGWPTTTVVDQRQLDPALGPLFSPRLVDLARGSEGRVLCVLNRVGRARMLACTTCSTLASCEVCDAAVGQLDDHQLTCPRCGTTRPVVCLNCGGTGFKNLRLGVSRAREELEALVGEPVGEVSAAAGDAVPDARVLVGTEAVLHRVPYAEAVAFLDFDQELLAPRYRGAEEALALLARAARAVRAGPGRPAGQVLVQTRTPDHTVLLAAQQADPPRLVAAERPLRQALRFPPASAMAVVSGKASVPFMERFGRPLGVEVQGPVDGAWRLRAADHQTLCDALAQVERPPGRLRLQVDPLRI